MGSEMLEMQRVYDYLRHGRRFRKISVHGEFSLGGRRYNAGKVLAGQSVEIRFDAQSQEFACVAEDGRSFRLKA